MEANQKQQIVDLILTEKSRLGSFAKVAKKCGVSDATISLMRNKKWSDITISKWQEVGQALGYRPETWIISNETRDFQYVLNLCESAKEKAMFMMISNAAGSGKTTGLDGYCQINAERSAYYMKAREWSAKVFLQRIIGTLGKSQPNGYKTADELLDIVIDGWSSQTSNLPILCIDEFDKLKPSAQRVLIYLFNELEGKLSLVIAGTENLSKEIKQGVKYSKKGYDELESRFGRTYIQMVGANKSDVIKICQANGVTNSTSLDLIWKEVGTKWKQIEMPDNKPPRQELICDDLRRLKRIIQREQIRLTNAA